MSLQQAVATYRRPTIEDPPDPRIRPVFSSRKLTPQQVRALGSQHQMDPRLRSVDRLLLRWAATPGSAAMAPRLARPTLLYHTHENRPAPLDDAESKRVGATVRTSPVWARTFVLMWYRYEQPVAEIARELSMKRRQSVYEERKLVFSYYLGRFHEIGIRIPSWEPDL